MVEQLELVASSTVDLLAAFHVKPSEEQSDGEWHDVRSEMERYGEQKEKASLTKAEMPLKKGVVGAHRDCDVVWGTPNRGHKE